jgi:hypothetical protein
MRKETPEPIEKPEFTEEQEAYLQEQIKAAQEERDYVNACDRRYRSMMLMINQERLQNIDGVPITDKFEVDSWQKEWNEFRIRHGLPKLDFELMKELAAAKKAQR